MDKLPLAFNKKHKYPVSIKRRKKKMKNDIQVFSIWKHADRHIYLYKCKQIEVALILSIQNIILHDFFAKEKKRKEKRKSKQSFFGGQLFDVPFVFFSN